MPELPEVETVVRGLRPLLEGRRIARVTMRRENLRQPFPPDLGQRLTGARITGLGRRAKYGLIHTDRADTLIFHLGMSGYFHWLSGPPAKHDHLLIAVGDAEGDSRTLALNDARRFGSVALTTTNMLESHPPFLSLGPEPLSEAFNSSYLAEAAKDRRTPIKALLLNQERVAGIGNIYACEALYMAGIDPTAVAASLSAARLNRLADALKAVLLKAIAAGGSTLRDHRQPDGNLGYFQHEFLVYGQEGAPCPGCGTPIMRITQSGRSTFFCPQCQS